MSARFDVRLVLFDLDGTLIDSAPDLALSVDETCVELGLPAQGETAVRGWVGDGIAALVSRALHAASGNEPGEQALQDALQVFGRHYARNNGALSQPYPGATILLQDLREHGYALGCVTNKSAPFTVPLLQRFELHGFMDAIVCGDQVDKRKPAPDALWLACEQAGVARERTLFVGDSRNDVRASQAAGLPVVCVSYGYNYGEDVASYNPDAVVDTLSEVGALLGIGRRVS